MKIRSPLPVRRSLPKPAQKPRPEYGEQLNALDAKLYAAGRASAKMAIRAGWWQKLIDTSRRLNLVQVNFMAFTIGDLLTIFVQNSSFRHNCNISPKQRYELVMELLAQSVGNATVYWPTMLLARRLLGVFIRGFTHGHRLAPTVSPLLADLTTIFAFSLPVNDCLKQVVVARLASYLGGNPQSVPGWLLQLLNLHGKGLTVPPSAW